MKDPIVVLWFLFAVTVTVWRMVKGWTFWFDLFVFGLAAFAMLVMQQAFVGGTVAGGSMRALGGTVLFTAAYWFFFDRAKADRGRPGDEIGDARSALR